MDKYKEHKVFGGEIANEYNAIYDAIHACGDENCGTDLPIDAPIRDKAYEWLQETPRTSLTAELVNKLHDMGFKIVRSE